MLAQAERGFPRLELAHLVATKYCDGRRSENYTLYRIPIPRPGTGTITAPVVCGNCRTLVQCKIRSLPSLRWLRCIWLGCGCGVLGSEVPLGYWLAASLVSDAYQHGAGSAADSAVSAVIAMLLVVVLGVALIVHACATDGVRIVSDPARRHSLRTHGSNGASYRVRSVGSSK